MGYYAQLKQSIKRITGSAKTTDIICDVGSGACRQPHLYQPAGDDSQGLPGDFLYIGDAARNSTAAVIGSIDPINEQKSGPGEKRIYARKEDGTTAVEIWLKADGSVIASNEIGGYVLNADGSVNINGITILANGEITGVTKINGIEYMSHTHTGVTSGTDNSGGITP